MCKSACCPSLQTAGIYLKQGAIFSLVIQDLTSLLHICSLPWEKSRDSLQNKVDTKAKILFLNSSMLKKNHRMSLHLPFPLPT